MHRNNTQYILFDTQYMYQFQKSDVLCLCLSGSVNREPNTVNARQICVYATLFAPKANAHLKLLMQRTGINNRFVSH